MKEVEKKVYQADDGKIFESRQECEKYEAEIAARAKRTTYWRVTHGPDLTEGRGYYKTTLLEVYGPEYGAEAWVRDWCTREIGRPIAFVQGVAPMDNWTVRQIDREQYLKDGQHTRVGDYTYPATRLRLVKGPRETGLVADEEDRS